MWNINLKIKFYVYLSFLALYLKTLLLISNSIESMCLMFISDLPLYTDFANNDFYTDDTTLYVIGKSLALDCLAK